MVITVLGGNGQTGVVLVKQALAAGHDVHSLVHHDNGLEKQPKLAIFVGDATKPEDVVNASKGSDLIISVLGTNSAKSSLMTDAIQAVIAASETTGVKRFILMSNFAAGENQLGGGLKLVGGLAKRVFKDKITSEDILRSSDLDWTIVHATRLTDDQKDTHARVVSPSEKITASDSISRAAVATWMLNEAKRNAHSKGSVTISR